MRIVVPLAVLLFFTSCATMVNGRYQRISVDSYPSGTSVRVNCGDKPYEAGVTPLKVRVLRAAAECVFTFERDGYETKTISLEHQQSRATSMNAVFGLPAAIVGGMIGALAGAVVNGENTGADMGVDAGWDAGRAMATDVDNRRGGLKWAPARIYATLVRAETEAAAP